MMAPSLQFLLSSLTIIMAGWFLVKFADEISDITKLGRLLVGSILLAGATSLPELSVDLNAVADNMPDLAVGDLIGSSLFNLLILAIADFLQKGPSSFFSKASSKHALSAAMSINLTAIAGMAIFLESKLFGLAFFEIGFGTIAIAVAYILGMRLIYVEQRATWVSEATKEKINKRKLFKTISGYLASAIVILIAAPYLSEAAGEITELSGLGKTFVGTTLVALSTSLPELVSTISAVRRGSFDLAVGNIFGSNTFNMLLLIPLDFAFTGSLLASVSIVHVFTCFSTILITSIALMGQLFHVEKHRRLIEPDALVIILLVLTTIMILFYLT